MHEHVRLISAVDWLPSVAREARDAARGQVGLKGAAAGEDDVQPQVELETLDEQWVGQVALHDGALRCVRSRKQGAEFIVAADQLDASALAAVVGLDDKGRVAL